MHTFNVTLQKMGAWTIAVIRADAKKIFRMSGHSVRVKGTIEGYPFSGTSLMPMKAGTYVLAIRKEIRKAIRRDAGDTVTICIEQDTDELAIPQELLDAFEASPEAKTMFETLSYSYKANYTRPISTSRNQATRERRAVDAVLKLERLYLEKQQDKRKA